jgi:two-component system sporulation sensor kinase A
MPILIQNMDAVVLDLIREELRDYIKQVNITSLLIVPLQIANKTIGTISLFRSLGSQAFTDDDQALVEVLAHRTAQTVHNARLYQELQNALQKELETHDQLVQTEKFAAVGRLLASITHEINNPLQTIKNCLYLIQMDTKLGTPAYDALSMATSETNRLSNLVAQLREIYRPPTHGQSRPVQISTLLGEVQTLLAGYLQEKHVTWELVTPSPDLFEGVVIEGVPDQLKQVFLNICINAIDAMEPDGGTITISFNRSEDADRLGICIRDTGPGLTQEVKDKLFEPFTTSKEKGLGLGLVICYDIIQKHNGSIEVESEPGEGAAFTLWLPASKKEA